MMSLFKALICRLGAGNDDVCIGAVTAIRGYIALRCASMVVEPASL